MTKTEEAVGRFVVGFFRFITGAAVMWVFGSLVGVAIASSGLVAFGWPVISVGSALVGSAAATNFGKRWITEEEDKDVAEAGG